jgi:lysophospholipase L1-like esterase
MKRIVLAVTALLLTGCDDPRRLVCATAGNGKAVAVLIIGDSWAARGRLNQPMANRIAKRAGAARVCSLAFPGRTSAEINADLPVIAERFDHVLLLVGVNDVVRHTGARVYGAAVSALALQASAIAPDVEMVSIPRVDLIHQHGAPEARRDHLARIASIDGGLADVTDRYRALAPILPMINYDAFLPSYAGHESRYRSDGIHLTAAGNAAFGAFLADKIRH